MKLLIFCILAIASSCSSPSKLKINSVPEGATVSVKSSDGSHRVLGKTPLEVPIREALGSGRLNSLLVSKEGYGDYGLMLARDATQENYDIQVLLQSKTEDPKVADSRERQEKLAKNLVQAHNLIAVKRFEEAKNLLNSIVQEFPHISVAYDLMGNLAYLQKDLRAARDYYERSLSINPENQDTRLMVDRLKGMLQ